MVLNFTLEKIVHNYTDILVYQFAMSVSGSVTGHAPASMVVLLGVPCQYRPTQSQGAALAF